MESSEWAAWVQAVGSIAAIIAAGWIASSQRRHERKLREEDAFLLARDHALVIAKAVQDWRASWREHLLQTQDYGSHITGLYAVSDVTNLTKIPKELQEMVGRFHELGQAAPAVQRLMRARALLADERDSLIAFRMSDIGGTSDAEALRSRLDGRINEMSESIDGATEDLVNLADGNR